MAESLPVAHNVVFYAQNVTQVDSIADILREIFGGDQEEEDFYLLNAGRIPVSSYNPSIISIFDSEEDYQAESEVFVEPSRLSIASSEEVNPDGDDLRISFLNPDDVGCDEEMDNQIELAHPISSPRYMDNLLNLVFGGETQAFDESLCIGDEINNPLTQLPIDFRVEDTRNVEPQPISPGRFRRNSSLRLFAHSIYDSLISVFGEGNIEASTNINLPDNDTRLNDGDNDLMIMPDDVNYGWGP
jgi:hypothetical protein